MEADLSPVPLFDKPPASEATAGGAKNRTYFSRYSARNGYRSA
jgi:hypothetical protein